MPPRRRLLPGQREETERYRQLLTDLKKGNTEPKLQYLERPNPMKEWSEAPAGTRKTIYLSDEVKRRFKLPGVRVFVVLREKRRAPRGVVVLTYAAGQEPVLVGASMKERRAVIRQMELNGILPTRAKNKNR